MVMTIREVFFVVQKKCTTGGRIIITWDVQIVVDKNRNFI